MPSVPPVPPAPIRSAGEHKIWFDQCDRNLKLGIVKCEMSSNTTKDGGKAVRHQEKIMDLFVSSRKNSAEDVDQLIDKASELADLDLGMNYF